MLLSLKQVSTLTFAPQLSSLAYLRYALEPPSTSPQGLKGHYDSNIFRSFFAEKAFSKQLYEMSSRVPSYRDYADGKLPEPSGVLQTTMEVLRRGRSQRADMFLDWLVRSLGTCCMSPKSLTFHRRTLLLSL